MVLRRRARRRLLLTAGGAGAIVAVGLVVAFAVVNPGREAAKPTAGPGVIAPGPTAEGASPNPTPSPTHRSTPNPSRSAPVRGPGTTGAPCTSVLTDVPKLMAAVAALRPGRVLCLAPGTYRLSNRLTFSASQSGTAAAPATLRARDGMGSVLIDAAGAEEALYFTGARHVVVQGLRITNGAYHAIKIDAPSSDLYVRDNALFDNFRAGDDQQYSAVKGCCLTQRVVLERNEIYYTRRGPGNNHQGIDCNSCKAWIVRANRVHGIRAQQYGTAAQFKSGSADTVIEDDRIYDNFIGIGYGGFGTPSWGNETYEHVRGIVRNNIVYGNDDAGITVINTLNGRVYNNTLFRNGFTPDVRVAAVNLAYRNNILDRPLNLRDGTTASASGNYVLPTAKDASIFVNAAGGDFRPKATASAVVGRGQDLAGDVPDDASGAPRPRGAYDIGALQHR